MKNMHYLKPVLLIFVFWITGAFADDPKFTAEKNFTRADRLRGSVSPERGWWDVLHYDLSVDVDPRGKTIEGINRIRFRVLKPARKMQIDLQQPLKIVSVIYNNRELGFQRDGAVYWISFDEDLEIGSEPEITIHYQGKPRESKNPPWSGGFSWEQDDKGRDFIATSCQGIGASIWWPNKDHGYDEPDDGVAVRITVPEKLTAVSNGRLVKTVHDHERNTKTWHWRVTQPINNYAVNVNIGHYVHFADTYQGKFGKLDMQYWVLDHQREKAMKHFKEAPRTIEAFEHWFGKYPFYEDGYKLVVVPYLGMEHQSSVTYGNGFQNGYRGKDLSDTGVGMKFDFVIVHETGHEWFGNNVSMKDTADLWIHESFTNYSENLFVEYHFSKKEGHDYVLGCRKHILNDRPIIGTYNVNRAGSGDMYYKGGNVLHMLRHMIDDDQKWLRILRGLNQEFWHQVVTTEQIENYIATHACMDLKPFFDQYLRTTDIPVLRYQVDGKRLVFQFEKIVSGFSYPIRMTIDGQKIKLTPTGEPQTLVLDHEIQSVELDRNFLITLQEQR